MIENIACCYKAEKTMVTIELFFQKRNWIQYNCSRSNTSFDVCVPNAVYCFTVLVQQPQEQLARI